MIIIFYNSKAKIKLFFIKDDNLDFISLLIFIKYYST